MTSSFRILRQMPSRYEDMISTAKASQSLRNELLSSLFNSRFRTILELCMRFISYCLVCFVWQIYKTTFRSIRGYATKVSEHSHWCEKQVSFAIDRRGLTMSQSKYFCCFFCLISFVLLRRFASCSCSCIYSYTSKPIHRCGRQQHPS